MPFGKTCYLPICGMKTGCVKLPQSNEPGVALAVGAGGVFVVAGITVGVNVGGTVVPMTVAVGGRGVLVAVLVAIDGIGVFVAVADPNTTLSNGLVAVQSRGIIWNPSQ